MAEAILSNFRFQHLLSHTFPGFFSAITLFMLLDIWSPLNLTSIVFGRGFEGLIAFTGFVLLIGSILGVIIDGINHCFIEALILENVDEIGDLDKKWDGCVVEYWIKMTNHPYCKDYCTTDCGKCKKECKHDCDKKSHCVLNYCPKERFSLGRFYFYKYMQDQFSSINNIIIDEFYCYYEFYSNSVLSLILFSFVAPLYAYSSLLITSDIIIILIISTILTFTFFCIKASYEAYRRYNKAMVGILRGYTDDAKSREIYWWELDD